MWKTGGKEDMESGNSSSSSSGLGRTKSDQLVEMVVAAAANKSPASNESPAGVVGESGGGSQSRKWSRRASPGGKRRKSRSAQLKVEIDEVSSGAGLSRASSASLGLSFSFTGFTLPPDDDGIADYNPFSDDDDDDIPEDIEAGTRKPKFQTEPTPPIYLKATIDEASY